MWQESSASHLECYLLIVGQVYCHKASRHPSSALFFQNILFDGRYVLSQGFLALSFGDKLQSDLHSLRLLIEDLKQQVMYLDKHVALLLVALTRIPVISSTSLLA